MTPALRAAYIASVQARAPAKYAVQAVDGTLRARNPAQGFDVDFGSRIVVQAKEGRGDYRLSLGLARYGCEGDLQPVAGAVPSASGNRVEYTRRGDGAGNLVEWYVNGPLGLEQGFTLEQALNCRHARDVVLEMDLAGTLVAEAEGGDAVLFREAGGDIVAQYKDLYVEDALGRELPAEMEAEGSVIRIRFNDAGATYPIVVDPLLAVERKKLLASNGSGLDGFGRSVAISGDTAIAGAPGHGLNATGAAYVFVRVGGQWTEQAELLASDGSPTDEFGHSVGLDGDTAVVTTYADGTTGFLSGSAYIFTRAGGTWTEQAKLQGDSADGNEGFGTSVAIFGDTAVVGAIYGTNGLPTPGAAYIFVRVGAAWSQQAKLLASDGDVADYFGIHVALSTDTTVVGADGDDQNRGAAYVFVRTGTSWSEQTKLVASDGSQGNQFGAWVGISGETAMIGARSAIVNGKATGAAYVFGRAANVWTEEAKLAASDGAGSDGFGAVAVSGNVAVVGAGADDDNGHDSGSAYLFERTGSTWTERAKLLPSDGEAEEAFGYAVAMSDGTAIVGAFLDDDKGTHSGSAYIFDIVSSNGDPCTTATDCASGHCVNNICCDKACNAGPCEACTVATGAPTDGTCAPLTGPACDDNNACTQTDLCEAGVCTGSDPVPCPPAGPCEDTCDPVTGLCAVIEKPDGSPCDDGNACTLEDTCTTNVCAGSSEVSCPVPDECHDAGLCDPSTGECSSPAKPDGAPCALGTCQEGNCEPDGGEGGGGRADGQGGAKNSDDGPLYIDGGCGCRVGTSPASHWPWIASALAALGAASLRRKLRKSVRA